MRDDVFDQAFVAAVGAGPEWLAPGSRHDSYTAQQRITCESVHNS